jgi:osmotically-inducible protein OsmY
MAMRMRTKILVVAGTTLCGMLPLVGFAKQEGVGQKVSDKLNQAGQAIKKETRKVTDAISKEFDKVKADVGRMGIHHRVYSRIHWDKALHSSKIEVHVFKGGAVLLRGTVPDAAAKARAVALANDTVDVTEVTDELSPLASADTAGKATGSTSRPR